MNKQRRRAINDTIDHVEQLRGRMQQALDGFPLDELKNQAAAIHEHLDGIHNEEQEAYDNMPEGLQQGEKGADSEAALSSIEAAMEAAQEFESQCDAIQDAFNEFSDLLDTINDKCNEAGA